MVQMRLPHYAAIDREYLIRVSSRGSWGKRKPSWYHMFFFWMNFSCPKENFRCTYGACVSLSAKCDGRVDCADKSDENHPDCPVLVNQAPTTTCKLVYYLFFEYYLRVLEDNTMLLQIICLMLKTFYNFLADWNYMYIQTSKFDLIVETPENFFRVVFFWRITSG